MSVVVPTHDRCDSLGRLLDALSAGTLDPDRFETIVVADGCTDGTASFVRAYHSRYALRLLELPGLGAASARNSGAADARGTLLVFLDDDIEPVPALLATYLAEHDRKPGRLLIGCSQPVIRSRTFFEAELRRWWQDHILSMQRVDHRFGYRDMHAGNFSLAAKTYAAVGGFDEAFPGCGGEDYELGIRLLAAGIPFAFCRDAVGYHHDDTDLDRSLRRACQEGRADVLIGRRHPHLRRDLPLSGGVRHGAIRRWIARLAGSTGLETLRNRVARLRIELLELAHLRNRAVLHYGRLRRRCYLRGAEHELGSPVELERFVAAAPPATPVRAVLDVDLQQGLERARLLVDEQRPRAARLRFGSTEIALVPDVPGAEPLRGAHLTASLLSSGRLVATLALESAVTGLLPGDWADTTVHDPTGKPAAVAGSAAERAE